MSAPPEPRGNPAPRTDLQRINVHDAPTRTQIPVVALFLYDICNILLSDTSTAAGNPPTG